MLAALWLLTHPRLSLRLMACHLTIRTAEQQALNRLKSVGGAKKAAELHELTRKGWFDAAG